jgi:hypothetical protein
LVRWDLHLTSAHPLGNNNQFHGIAPNSKVSGLPWHEQCVVRCSAGAEERPLDSLAQEPRAYGQARGVIPFSCAYLAAAASTKGGTNAWSGAIQSLIGVHCVPFHCWNFTLPPPP